MTQPIKIGINGFGRIGRKIVRLALQNDNVEIVGINDLGSIHTLAHLLKYDSVHGNLAEDVKVEGDLLCVGQSKVKCFTEKDPSQLPWKSVGADYVHECTGVFKDKESNSMHLNAGAKKVIISAPAKDPDHTICMGVNEKTYKSSEHHILSNASCTTNCLSPLVKVLDENYGVVRGTMTTIHSYTNDQRILDLPHSDLRRARAAATSQIPTTTGAAKAVGLVLPHLKGKLDGFAVRIPTPNVSLVDFTCELKDSTSKEKANSVFKKAAETDLKGILGYCNLPLVSTDFNGDLHSSVLDSSLTTVMDGNFIKVVSWYDNESGFSARMLDLTLWMSQNDN